jgi:nodulation protein A
MTDPDVEWTVVWESDLDEEAHRALADLLTRCFPHSTRLGGARSWSSGRPEVRLLGRRAGRPVAHLAVLRRFLRVPARGRDLLVGDVGLVGVDPAAQGTGLGRQLLARAHATLTGLDVPFGFLTCGPRLVDFYARGGWVRVANPTRHLRWDGRARWHPEVSMALPVRATAADWPGDDPVDRNGYEV